MKHDYRIYTTLFLFLFFIVSCQKVDVDKEHNSGKKTEVGFASNEMVLYWNDKIATVLGAPMNQPTRARFFAIMHIAMHDALNSIKPKYERYALLNERQQFASPNAAVASAAYWVIEKSGRKGTFPLETWYNESMATIEEGESKEMGIALGKAAAEAIVNNRAGDGFSSVQLNSTNPPDGTEPGQYRHTNLLNVRYLPTWGTLVKPFVLTSNYQFRSDAPNPVTSAAIMK